MSGISKVRFWVWTGLLSCSVPLVAQHAKLDLREVRGQLCLEVQYHDKVVVEASPVGLNVDHVLLGTECKVREEARTLMADSDGYRNFATTYAVERDDTLAYYIDVREFDDGVALRYRIPSAGPRCVYDEQTSFTFPVGTHVWYASGPFQYGWVQAYQDRVVGDIAGELLAPPATFRLPDGSYAALTEANLRHYHGAVLFGQPGGRVQFGYVENEGHVLAGTSTGIPAGPYQQSVVCSLPWMASPRPGSSEIVTPWRVLMLADDLDGLVNNRIIAQVADKPDPELFPQGAQTDWIRPGRSVFTWLVEGDNRLSVANHKRYVDGAAELGLQSVVVDDGWELWPRTEPDAAGKSKWDFLKELVDYASARGVDIWVWRPSSPRYGNKDDVGLQEAGERRAFMKKCAEIGVKGLKVDFFHTENTFTVDLMEEILREAARNRLMVIFHGVNKPTGDSYTFPNLLAKEAVRGLECVGGEDSWAPGPPWPYHNTVLPFTRWLAGPADYTPLNFRAFCPPSVTFAHQLASIYMFTSPMLIFAADMEDMLACPGRQFIEEVPVTWDETRVLPESHIGRLAALARRKGDVWYLTVMNGESPYDGELTLDFLPRGRYLATLAADDGENRKKIVVHTSKVKGGQKWPVSILAGGGLLVKLERKD